MISIKKPKVFIPLIAVVVAVVVVLIVVLGNPQASSAAVLQSVSSVISSTSASNRYSGIVETQKGENVAFDTSQKLDKLLVKEGDTVKKGAPLFSYNTDSINLAIQKLQVENEIRQNTIKSNNEQIARYQNMMANASGSEQITYNAEIQQLQADNSQLEYDIKTKAAEIEAKQKSLENSTVTSPIDGTIKKILDPSSLSGDNPNADPSAFITITASGNLRVKGSVGEQNIYEINVGTNVIVRSRVSTAETWSGTVASIETQSTESDQKDMTYYSPMPAESSTKYPFYVDLESTEGLILGQHVTIEVDYGQAEARQGIWLSSAWLTFEGDNAYILAAKTASGPAEKRLVTLGEYDPNLDEYEIVSGLSEAEYIALPEASVENPDLPGNGDSPMDGEYPGGGNGISAGVPAEALPDSAGSVYEAPVEGFAEEIPVK